MAGDHHTSRVQVRSEVAGMERHEDQSLLAEVAGEGMSSTNHVEGKPGWVCWARMLVLGPQGMSY
jgi:hypothetical protein